MTAFAFYHSDVYPRFTAEEIGVTRCEGFAQGHAAQKQETWDRDPGPFPLNPEGLSMPLSLLHDT